MVSVSTTPANPQTPSARSERKRSTESKKPCRLKPSFVIHTGDITHLSKPSEIRQRPTRVIAQGLASTCNYVPGEHDFLDDEQKLYRGPLMAAATKGRRLWVQLFDANGVAFSSALVNVFDLKAGRPGGRISGNEQLEMAGG